MLDTFLKVAYDRTKETEDQARLVTSLRSLPEDYLQKLASGEEKLAFFGDSSGCWLEKYKGTPLLEQAIELEKRELEQQMAEKARWREEDKSRSETNIARDEVCIQKRLLDLQLAELEGGAGGGEEPAEEMVEEEVEEEELPEEQEPTPPHPVQEGEDSKPKVGVKVAAFRMGMAMNKIAKDSKKKEIPMSGAGRAVRAASRIGLGLSGSRTGTIKGKPYVVTKKKKKEAAANARFVKEAIGLGMLAKTLGAAGKNVGGAGMQAAKSAKGFGAGNMDAAKMGLGAMKGQAARVMPAVAQAGKSYAKANPMQAAGLAGGAGLASGLALG